MGGAGGSGWRGRCEGGGSGYWPFEPHPSRRNGRVGSVAGRGTGAASGRRPHARGDGGGAKRAQGSSGSHNNEAPTLGAGHNGPRGFDPEAGVAPPTPCGARTGAQGPRKRTLWCGHSRTEEKMSTLAASGIAMVGTCTSKGMLVIGAAHGSARLQGLACNAQCAGMRDVCKCASVGKRGL